HRLDERVRQYAPEHGEGDTHATVVDERADGEDPPGRRETGDPRDDEPCPQLADPRRRESLDRVRVGGEENDVRVDEPAAAVRQCRVVAVARDVDEPATVPLAEQRGDVASEVTRHEPEDEESEQPGGEIAGERRRRRARRCRGLDSRSLNSRSPRPRNGLPGHDPSPGQGSCLDEPRYVRSRHGPSPGRGTRPEKAVPAPLRAPGPSVKMRMWPGRERKRWACPTGSPPACSTSTAC